MRGDRLANELWYQLETQTRVEPSDELLEAYLSIQDYAIDLGGLDTGLLFAWLGYYDADLYPSAYADWLEPVRGALVTISRIQLEIFDRYYPPRRRGPSRDLVHAFADFGQGVLYDPRHLERVHHNANIIAYTVWHAFATGMVLLGIDRRRWKQMIPLVHYARKVQEVAQPVALEFNDPLPGHVLRRITRESLPMTLGEIDQSTFEFDYPFDIDAIPKPPGL